MPPKRKTAKRRMKKTVETALPLQATESAACGVTSDVEDNVNEESCSANKPSTVCFESGSFEKPQESDSEPNKFDVAGSAEAIVARDAQAAIVNAELETHCQSLILQAAGFNPSEQCSISEVPLSAESMQPSPPEVLKQKKQTVADKKRSQKQNSKADDKSTKATEGNWEISNADDNSKKNVVLIRRQHPSGIPDSGFPASSQSQISCETAGRTQDRNMSCDTDEVSAIGDEVSSVSCGPVEGIDNTENIDTACLNLDVTSSADVPVKNVNSLPSTDGGDIAIDQSTHVRPKRRGKMTANREGCRKSQRCTSRRQEADKFIVTTPVNASTAEAKTAGSCDEAQMTGDENAPCFSSAREEVSQEQVKSLQSGADVHNQMEPVSSISSSVNISQTEVSMGSCDPAILNSANITAASVDKILPPVASAASTENSDSAPESMSKSYSSDTSHGQCPSGSAYSHINSTEGPVSISSASPTVIKHEVKLEQPWNNDDSSVAIKVETVAVKRESDGTMCSRLVADFDASSRMSNDTSLLNTCLSGTFLETLVSPEERLSRGSVIHPIAADQTVKEEQSTRTLSGAAVINTLVSREDESEELCKTILEEVVTNVVKETLAMSVSEESIESSLSESPGQVSHSAVAQNESDSTSGEIPLKKRRGRRVFADSQPNDAVTVSHHSGEDHRDDISSRSVSRRRKIPRNNSHRRSLPGRKYVGAHTSVVGNVACAVQAAAELGSLAFGMFIKCQNKLQCEPLSSEEVSAFKKALVRYGYSPAMILPHGSYLLNCGSSDPKVLHDSRESLVDDLQRCRILGLPHFNFHPGSFGTESGVDECIERIAESINYAHGQVEKVVTVLENMPGQAGTVGGSFLELRRIINRIKDKSRVGICLDTCHAFAAGYDIRTESGYDEMMHDLQEFIGLKYLKALHVNDSRDDVGSHVDHHASIGRGRIGPNCFHRIMNDSRFENLPLILETPMASHSADIDLLYSFVE